MHNPLVPGTGCKLTGAAISISSSYRVMSSSNIKLPGYKLEAAW
jgi:hypothetical protein